MRSGHLWWALLFGMISAGPLEAQSEAPTFPSKPVRIIVPYTAGGGTDTVARGLAQHLSEQWGQPVIVENRPGAATMIGAEAAAKAAPDGHTLLFSDSATFVINPHLSRKVPYRPLVDFAPITLVVRLAPVVAVSAMLPVSTHCLQIESLAIRIQQTRRLGNAPGAAGSECAVQGDGWLASHGQYGSVSRAKRRFPHQVHA